VKRGIVLAIIVLAMLRPANARSEPRAAAAGSEDGSSFTLEAALAATRRGHPLLRAASSVVAAAHAYAFTSGHWTNPIVDATWLQAVRRSSYDPSGVPSIGVTQFIEIAGAPRARRRSALAEAHATESDREALLRDLEWSVREAVIRLAAEHERRRIQEDALADLERAEGIVLRRVDAGRAPRYDASRIAIAVEQVRADAAEAAAAIARTRGDLEVAVGPSARELNGVPRYDLAEPPASSSLELAELEAARRADVVAARRRAEAAGEDVAVAKRSVAPGIGVRLGAGYGQAPGQADVSVGVVVPLPVLERGGGSIVAARAVAEERRARADALESSVVQRVRSAHAELSIRVAAFTKYREHVRQLDERLRSEAEAGYRDAKLSVLELVDALRSLRDARLRAVDLAEAAHLAKTALGRAVGGDARER